LFRPRERAFKIFKFPRPECVNIKINSKKMCLVDPAHEVYQYFMRAETCNSETA